MDHIAKNRIPTALSECIARCMHEHGVSAGDVLDLIERHRDSIEVGAQELHYWTPERRAAEPIPASVVVTDDTPFAFDDPEDLEYYLRCRRSC